MDRIGEIMRLILECSPTERAEVLRLIRGRMVESRTGLLTKEDFERVIASTANLNEAAVQLDVSRRTLQYHMRLFGLPPRRPGHYRNGKQVKAGNA